ncbi:CpXC domain-containing protein [Thomasclavelia sp.]
MTNFKLEVTCVHCLENGKMMLYPIINERDLKVKNSIIKEELFLYRCPHCGHYQRVSYECIYYDDKLNYAIILSHDGDKLLKKSKLEFKNYQIRFVKELKELKEKIIIIENNLDDRIIEIMKHDIRMTLVSKATYDLILNDKLVFEIVYPNGEVLKTYPFSKYSYMIEQKKYKNYLGNDYNVDKIFASKLISKLKV